ncbi:hypothetical protein [Actinocrispum wychmicini]|uniref:Lipoprotein n=1 Tax=Actinocrispum wychmicini TaxID=1213861 RepID=A0A4R2JFJ9_9PSEU|nr:hypothetical protein [Actinocrispum wychmicini]TCO53025.1 hypothetical protein EV192_111222 [Actinocrispum wychmicini]
MRRRNLALLAVLPLVAALGTACSSSGTAAGSTALSRAMSRIADTPATSGYVEFGDTAAIRGNPDYKADVGYGWSVLSAMSFQLGDVLGVDLTKITSAVSAGQPPDTTGLLLGEFDPSAIGTKLRGVGAREEKSGDLTKWTFGEDHTIDVNGPFADLGIVGQLNKVAAGPGMFAYASADAGLQAATGTGKSLAENATLSALADCLGDVRFAVLAVTQQKAPLAAGVRDNPTTEVLCVLAPDSGKAQDWAKTVADRLANDMSAQTRQPWHTLLTDVHADVTGDKVVRVTARPAAATRDVFLRAILTKDVGNLVPAS